MSSRRRKSPARSKTARRAAAAADFWGTEPYQVEVPRIRRSDDPSAVVRSLGQPPLPGRDAVAPHYYEAIYEKAAGVAAALAATAGLLVTDDDA